MTSNAFPKISIVTATRNRRDLLRRAIQSVADQAYDNKEHIVIDGASTDGTAEMLRSIQDQMPHLTWISEPDDGIADAFNKGLERASGELISVLGDDDIYLKNAFETIAQEYLVDPLFGVYVGNSLVVNSDDAPLWLIKASYTNHRDVLEIWNWGPKKVCIPSQSAFINRIAIDKVGGFSKSDRYNMDYRHWIHITEHFPVRIVDQTLSQFRYDSGTATWDADEKLSRETIAISRQYWGKPTQLSYWKTHLSYLAYEYDFISLRGFATTVRKFKLRFYPIYCKIMKRNSLTAPQK